MTTETAKHESHCRALQGFVCSCVSQHDVEIIEKNFPPTKESTALEWLKGTDYALGLVEFGTTKQIRKIGVQSLTHAIKKAVRFIEENRNVR